MSRPDDTAGTGERVRVDEIRERAERSMEFMQGVAPEGMVSRPHICRWSDELSIRNRDVLALVAAVREAEARAERLADRCTEAELRAEMQHARAERAERALRQIVALDQECAWIGQVEIARAALAAVSGEAPNDE